jgi:hypothetical protein
MSNLSELRDFYAELVTQVYFYQPNQTLMKVVPPTAVTYEDVKYWVVTSGRCWQTIVAKSAKDINSQLSWTEEDFRQVESYLREVV